MAPRVTLQQREAIVPFLSAREIRDLLKLEVSAETIRRRLHDADMKSLIAAQKTLLERSHREQRMEFASIVEDWTTDNWRCAVTKGRASKDLSGQCLYNRWGDTWVAFENAKSTGARVKSIMRWIAGVKHLSNASVAYCMAIWDLDLDDHRAECGDKPFPIVDAAVNELP
ncbi:hypothetical protein HPB48_001304 [Haemaphysalis longicornis]|uniref:Transposase Tc1-like domain-containing protein n=1 Tax=Haemaphysalis longicornis TaxID=44386 RepID=A0A9J6FP76_HAELO|nr:hypothetical protein HPB48_001304 [Haemaphysalis longicornis]